MIVLKHLGKNISLFSLILTSCLIKENQANNSLRFNSASNEEWSTFEGKWLTTDGVIRLELSLQEGSVGFKSNYKLHESFESPKLANGTTSHGKFSVFNGLPKNEIGIRLNNLNLYSKSVYFRTKGSNFLDTSEQMYFITRGDELIPCNDDFKPITLDSRYTLHRRLDYCTVEGYITFDNDTAQYFERNTTQYWRVAELGEFDSLKTMYKMRTSKKYEGLYLKALAYSIYDSTTVTEKALVIKSIRSIGNDPEQYELAQ